MENGTAWEQPALEELQGKVCKGPCGQWKPFGRFSKSRTNRDGLVGKCKDCCNATARARYWADPETSRETVRDKRRRLYAEDPEHYREAARAWRASNPERAREVSRECQRRRKAHLKPEVKAYKLRWARENPDLKAGQQLRYRARKKTTMVVRFTPEQVQQRYSMFGHRCWMCGAGGAMEPDHVKPLAKGGSHILAALRPSCRSCNATKNAQWFGVRETIAKFRTWQPAPMRLP